MTRKKNGFVTLRGRTRREWSEEIAILALGGIYSLGVWLLLAIHLWRVLTQP